MNKAILLESEASAEVNAAAQWYEERQTGLGHRYLQAVDSTLRQLVRHPHAGVRVPLVPPELGVRRVPVLRFPYAIVYIEITGVLRRKSSRVRRPTTGIVGSINLTRLRIAAARFEG